MIFLSNCREHLEQKKSIRFIMVFFIPFFFTPFSLRIYIELTLLCLLKSEHASMFVLKTCMILCFVCFEIALNLPRGLFGQIKIGTFLSNLFFFSLYRSRNLSLWYRYVARLRERPPTSPGIWRF